MTQYSKFNVIYRLQKWLDSVPGQTFMNYAYSWGAAVVILGTLFKLTHLPGANVMLFIGMGTEVFVFFISAFDRPFDKTADGKDLPTHFEEDEVEGEDDADLDEEEEEDGMAAAAQPAVAGVQGGGTIIIGGPMGTSSAAAAAVSPAEGMEPLEAAQNTIQQNANAAQNATSAFKQQWVAEQQQVSPEMAEATEHYVEELNKLTDMLSKVAEQSQRLTRDSEEMENLNRTLTGICKVYEMQLKGASAQIGTLDQIDEQQRRLAKQIEQLNGIYARMIEAMTVNMRAAAPAASTTIE